MNKEPQSKSLAVTIISLVALAALGYLVSVKIFNIDPRASFAPRKGTFVLTLKTTITKTSNVTCSPDIASYIVKADVYHRASMGMRATSNITIPLSPDVTTSVVTVNNPDGAISQHLQAGYYQYFYTVSAVDKTGKVLATKPGFWAAKSGSNGPTIKTTDAISFDCNLDILKPPVKTGYNVKTVYSVKNLSCNKLVTEYVVSVIPYKAVSGTVFTPLAQTFIIPAGTQSGSALVNFPELSATSIFKKQFAFVNNNSFFVYTVKGVDKTGKTVVAYTTPKTSAPGYTKPLYKFVAAPNIAIGNLAFDCLLGTVN